MIVITNGDSSFSRLIVDFCLKRIPAGDIVVTAQHPAELSTLAGLGVTVRPEDFSDPEKSGGNPRRGGSSSEQSSSRMESPRGDR
jgi:hypothetical protein